MSPTQKLPTKQTIFDTVARHLLTQGRPSIDKDGKCMYRGENGTKCAIGALIPDDAYVQKIENHKAAYALRETFQGHRELKSYNRHERLIRSLQELHDGAATEEVWQNGRVAGHKPRTDFFGIMQQAHLETPYLLDGDRRRYMPACSKHGADDG